MGGPRLGPRSRPYCCAACHHVSALHRSICASLRQAHSTGASTLCRVCYYISVKCKLSLTPNAFLSRFHHRLTWCAASHYDCWYTVGRYG